MTDLITPFACWGSNAAELADLELNGKARDYHNTRLFKVLEQGNWCAAMAMLDKDPTEATQWVNYQGVAGVGSFRRLPIHEACIHQPSEEVVEALIKGYPQGVREKDSDGQLPLHYACANGASVEVIELLLMECPDSLDVKNNWGNFPVDIAFVNSPSSRNVQAALRKRPTYYADKVHRKKNDELKLTIEELESELSRVRSAYDQVSLENQAYRSKQMQIYRVLLNDK